MPLLPELIAFVLGLLLGSFMNVCISRVPRGESILHPRSHCMSCGVTIPWYDNLPVLSWLLLRGRCRRCKAPVSWRYPAVELSTALWFLLTTLVTRHALSIATAPHIADNLTLQLVTDGVGVAILGFLLIGLMVIDWQTHTLPDVFTFSGMAVGFLLACVQAMFLTTGEGDIHFTPHSALRMQSPGSFTARGDVFLTGPEAHVLGRLLAIGVSAGLLLLIRALYRALRHREGLGLGDAKLMGMIAAFLGFGDAMLSFFLGMLTCAGLAVYMLATRRANAATKLPLGSFLAAGGLVTALLGEAVLTWYKSLL